MLTEIGEGVETLLAACAEPDAPVGRLLREAELRLGDIPVRSALPRLWRVATAREPVLDYLYANGWYEEYLRRARDYIVERLMEGDPLPPWYLDRYASEHLMHGAGDAFLRFTDRHAALEGQGRVGRARILASLGRIEEARRALAGAERSANPFEAFALGWIEHHFGDPEAAARARQRLETLESERVRRQMADWSAQAAAADVVAGKPVAVAIPFLNAALCSHDPALAADLAEAVRAFLDQGVVSDPGQAAALTIENLAAASTADRERIAATGLNLCALALMTTDCEAIEVLAADRDGAEAWSARLPRLDDEDVFQGFWAQPTNAVARSVNLFRGVGLHGGLRAICPWTGAALVSTESLCFSGFFAYRFQGAQEFWIVAAPLMFRRSWFWWPGGDVVIGLGPTFPTGDMRNRLANFRRFLQEREADIRAYRARPRRLAVVTGLEGNIGHHYHNELSGVYRVAASRLLRPEVGLSGPYDHYGALALLGLGQTIQPVDGLRALPDIVLREGLFVIWPSDFAAQRGLAEALLAQARRRPRSERLQDLLAAVAEAELVVVVGLRSRRRVWLNGPASLSELLGRLEDEVRDRLAISKVVVIFDGYTRTGEGGDEEDTFIERETAEIDALRGRPDFRFRGTVLSAVGLNLHEKALLFSHADAAICPKGNGHLPTLSWVTRTPAVVHSNSFEIGAAAGENAICDDAAPASVIDRAAIMDVLLPHVPWNRYVEQRGFAFEDYDLDRERVWAALWQTVQGALERKAAARIGAVAPTPAPLPS